MKTIKTNDARPESKARRRLSLREKAILWARRYCGTERCPPRGGLHSHCAGRTRSGTGRRVTSLLSVGALLLATGAVPYDAAAAQNPPGQKLAASADDREVRVDEATIAQHGYSAPALFNLANAFTREGKTGEAILNYERALWLAPHDAAVMLNLRLVRQKAGLAAPGPNPFERAARVFSPNTLAWIGSAALALLALGLVAGRLLPDSERRRIRATMAGAALVLALALADMGYWWTRLDRAVILSREAPARIAPASTAGVSFDLREGQVVRERKRHGNYVLVRTGNGNSGWVNRNQIGLILDDSSLGPIAPQG